VDTSCLRTPSDCAAVRLPCLLQTHPMGLLLWQQQGSSGEKRNLIEKLVDDWKSEEDPRCSARMESKKSQTTQCGCHRPLPTDCGDVVFIAPSQPQASVLPFPPTSLCPGWAGSSLQLALFGNLKSPKPHSSFVPAWCTVLWQQAQLAGGFHSGLPVRSIYWFRSTGVSVVWTLAPCPPLCQGQSS